jgi:hypothetical protein
MADNLTTFMCRLSRNLGASTRWNRKGLSRRVMGLLYLFTVVLYVIRYILLYEVLKWTTRAQCSFAVLRYVVCIVTTVTVGFEGYVVLLAEGYTKDLVYALVLFLKKWA